MKKILSLLFLFSFFTMTLACNFTNSEIEFSDASFEAAIRKIVNKEEGSIYASDVRNITELNLFGKNISSLEGIQYFVKLEKLDLEDNFIEDVTPLSELENLTWLSLRNNEITSLTEINFNELKDLPLSYLSLRHNVIRIGDDEQIRISDISILSDFTSLTSLELRDNHISDITPIEELTDLTYLDISQNPLTDTTLQGLKDLTKLTYLNVRFTGATDLEVLRGLKDLTYLNVHSNMDLTSIAFLTDLTQLETLIAQNVVIGDQITYLSGLTKLNRLNLQNTSITSLEVIRDLMAMGALQDKPLESIQAEVNIQSNPLPIEEYQLLKDYWPNISMRVPAILPTINPTTPVINELMASNGDFITDYQGDSEDWIEIYNPLNQPLDISRYYLSDDFENLLKWSFPEGTIIPTKGFLIVFASGKDLVATNGEIHTNFKINDEGESIILTSKDQQSILDYIPSTEIPRNYSYGRAVDGGNTWVYFDLMNSSPEETNNNSMPYSEDGSVIPDDLSTNIESFNRFFNDDIEKSIIIKITEEEWDNYDQEMLDYQSQFNDLRTDYYAKADFVYEDEEGQVAIGNIGFRTRGNMSRVRIQNDDGSLNMSNFKISFHETFDQTDLITNKSRTVFEVEELDMKWNRNYDDTYLTEKFSLDLMREFGVHAANATLAKVYIEISGERHFYGVYTIFEPIDELFIEKRFTGESNDGDLYKSLWQQFGPASLRTGYHPNAIGIKDESINYRPTYDIKTNKDNYDRAALESFIYNVSDTYGNDFYNYIKDHFDVDRFLRYLAVGVLLGNPDDYRAMANNYYLYHDPLVDKWTIIPYDYDHGMGQGWDGAPVFENWTIDADIYEWGDLNAFQEGKDYSNPLSKKILEIPEYQIIYEGYLAELINPDNNYFNFNHFNEMFENQKNLYQSSLSEAMMSLDFGLRNIHWYFEEKTASVSSQLSYYQTNPDRRP